MCAENFDKINVVLSRNQRNAHEHLLLRSFDVVPANPEPSWKASAILSSGNSDEAEQSEGGVSGEITFKQWNFNAPIQVYANISGLKPGKHAIHIHAFGDVTDGCKSTGPHFRHSIVGNVEANEEGKVDIKFNTLSLSLFGLSGVLGRSVVVHEKPSQFLRYPDIFNPESQFVDLGVSYQTEEDSVGERLSCGIITITSNISN
ncbi:hypothetical protein PVAND_007536 [Polypedilum vanderplanki]|uniref:superoxide dismutase n=1 Tax=Polypedilum vanderplanki TaxID=319348 RepID=A0A9J6C6U9_POLVA|nr:hypothetical protein PVAND_007536 [Polypedilum vanderplanki]